MKTITCAALLALAAPAAHAATYKAAHAKYREADFLFVIVNNEFFGQPADAKDRQLNAMRACARKAKLDGDVVIAASDKGRLRTYSDPKWTKFIQPLDWKWVNARVNNKLTC
jgi:hypothetical protein